MLLFKVLVIYLCVFNLHDSVYAAKRIKRNLEAEGNHTKTSSDFAVMPRAGNKDYKEMNATKPIKVVTDKLIKPSKETVSSYNEMLRDMEPILKKRKLMHSPHSISKPKFAHTTRSRNVDHIIATAGGRKDDKIMETPAEVVIIDNTPNAIPFLKAEHNSLYQRGDKSLQAKNIPQERNRAFATARGKIFTKQFLPFRNPPIGRFAPSPLERMFKLANMFMYNIENDESMPMRAPYASFHLAEDGDDEPQSIDYILNVIGRTTDASNDGNKSVLEQHSDDLEATLSKNEQHSHDTALIFKQPVPADEKVADLIENALDTLLSSSNGVDDNDEIEVHCPIHHERRNFAERAKGDGNGKAKKDDVIQVCSCHFVQNKKADDVKAFI